jgi:hypothetical protein
MKKPRTYTFKVTGREVDAGLSLKEIVYRVRRVIPFMPDDWSIEIGVNNHTQDATPSTRIARQVWITQDQLNSLTHQEPSARLIHLVENFIE